MKNRDQKICISLKSVNDHCFFYCSHLQDIDDWWQWGLPGTVPELIVQACCSDVRGERAMALTVNLGADYHPIPFQNGPDTDGSIRVTISGRLHCWTSVWVQKTGHDRTPVWFGVKRELGGRVGTKCLSHQSLRSPVIQWNCARQKEARKTRQKHKNMLCYFTATKLSTGLFEFPLYYQCIITMLADLLLGRVIL